MSLLTQFLKILQVDSPAPVTADQYPPEVNLALAEEVRARRAAEVARDAYRTELRMRGMSDLQLDSLAKFFDRALSAEVKRARL